MGREKQFGLSPREFVKRVKDSGHIATNWPFEDIFSIENFTVNYDESSAIPLHKNTKGGLLIGRMFSERDQPMMRVHNSDEYTYTYNFEKRKYKKPNWWDLSNQQFLHFEMTDSEIGAWKQMDGINVVLDVHLDSVRNYRTYIASINQVLGIEQPLFTPNAQGEYQNDTAGRDVGFIQGTVLEAAEPSFNLTAILDPGKESPPATVKGNYNARELEGSHQIWPINIGLKQGETLRARVRRNAESPHLFHINELPVYFLDRGRRRRRI